MPFTQSRSIFLFVRVNDFHPKDTGLLSNRIKSGVSFKSVELGDTWNGGVRELQLSLEKELIPRRRICEGSGSVTQWVKIIV
jgi:hypothetical protein